MSLYIIIAVIAAAVLLIFILAAFLLFKKHFSEDKGGKNRDRNLIIKQANKKLEQNPKDTGAISDLANIYYEEESYEKAMHLFKLLIDQYGAGSGLDEFDIVFKYAVSAMKNGKKDEAYKYFAYARSMNKEVFEINYNLGVIEYERKTYDKAYLLFSAARKLIPDHASTILYMGKILYHMGRFKDAVPYLRKSFDFSPGDKEILYLLAESYNESGQRDNAYKIFFHLRPDPAYGPAACLETGLHNLKKRDYQKASEDFEIGLRHKEIAPNIRLELLYQMAGAYIKDNKINSALKSFDIISAINPDYKDVTAQKAKYTELSSNKNLKTYLMAPTSEFVNLCRKITPQFFTGEHVKITDISAAKNDYVDIVSEVTSTQAEDIALFRFIRSSASVGDIMLRDLYFKSKDVRAGKSFCITAGSFSETAEKFVEARTIDLIGGKELVKILARISST